MFPLRYVFNIGIVTNFIVEAKYMMIDCPECGKQISSEAKVCPHCGAEKSLLRLAGKRFLDEYANL